MDYSKGLYQIPNIQKTVYCHFSPTPSTDPIQINTHTLIYQVLTKLVVRYLRMKFIPTNKFDEIIKFNLNDRKGRICKYYAWLEIMWVPQLRYSCLFWTIVFCSSLLYGVETCGDISYIEDELRGIELKALKTVLKVKMGTPSELVYNEFTRPDIISRIKDRQYKFFAKLTSINENAALAKSFLYLCENTAIVKHYKSLTDHNRRNEIHDGNYQIRTSPNSMMIRYRSITDINRKCVIYSSYMENEKRSVISRWRLSNHKLCISI